MVMVQLRRPRRSRAVIHRQHWLLFFTVVRNTVPDLPGRPGEGENMSVYRVTEVIGTSTESWEHAARSAVETAATTVREIRVAEVTRQDVTIENGQVSGYRVRLAISFKYESDR
jgi:flavin-binding protein dodecin